MTLSTGTSNSSTFFPTQSSFPVQFFPVIPLIVNGQVAPGTLYLRMKLFCIFVLIACSTFVSCDDSANLEAMTPEPRTAAMDAADLAASKPVATKFAADLMKVRTSEDLHDLTNNLMDSMVFTMCDVRMSKGNFVSYIAHALIQEDAFPTDLTLEAVNGISRDNHLSMLVKASGFIFEANDEIILDFKKQDDGSYKLSQGTVTTCKYP